VAQVKIAVRLRRKAGLDDGVAIFFSAHIFGDDVLEEVGGRPNVGLNFRAFRIGVRHNCFSLCLGEGIAESGD